MKRQIPSWTSHHQIKLITSTRAGLHLIEHCPKVSHGNLKTTQDIAETIGCSAETDRKALLLKTTSTQFVVLVEVKLMPTLSLHPYILGFWILEEILEAKQLQTILLTMVSCLQDMLA